MSGVEWGKIRRKLYVADATYSAQRITYHDRTPSLAALHPTVRRQKPWQRTWAAAQCFPALLHKGGTIIHSLYR